MNAKYRQQKTNNQRLQSMIEARARSRSKAPNSEGQFQMLKHWKNSEVERNQLLIEIQGYGDSDHL